MLPAAFLCWKRGSVAGSGRPLASRLGIAMFESSFGEYNSDILTYWSPNARLMCHILFIYYAGLKYTLL